MIKGVRRVKSETILQQMKKKNKMRKKKRSRRKKVTNLAISIFLVGFGGWPGGLGEVGCGEVGGWDRRAT